MINQLIISMNNHHVLIWFSFLLKCKSYKKTVDLNKHFTKNVIITLSIEHWISIYLSPLLILRNYRILKVLVLRVLKIQLTILTGLGLSKIKIAANNAKSYQKHFWKYFVTSFPIKLKNMIIKLLKRLINRLLINRCCLLKKNPN